MKGILPELLAPPGLILLGSILAAIGALWAASQRAEFERDLRLKSEEITALTKRSLDAATGGESYCYLTFVGNGPRLRLMVVHMGEHTLYDVSARIVNLDRFEELKGNLSFDTLSQTDTYLDLGTLIAGHVLVRGEVDRNSIPHRGYNIFFVARNGDFHETLRFAMVDGSSQVALRVYRDNQVILEKVDENFPKDVLGW